MEKINKSKYNKWYKRTKKRSVEILKEKMRKSSWRRIARFKLGNEMRESRYWKEKKSRKCRLCGGAKESWEHV